VKKIKRSWGLALSTMGKDVWARRLAWSWPREHSDGVWGLDTVRSRLARRHPQEEDLQHELPRDVDGLLLATVSGPGSREIVFRLDDPLDVVQRRLAQGRYYEMDQLRAHRELIFKDSTVLDVGANVGNHTVYYAMSRAARVYPFEPNPRPRELLARTVQTNGLDNVDLTYLALGVGASPMELFVGGSPRHNLGKTKLASEGQIAVQVRPLDQLDLKGPVSLLKIDTEGMEMEVLAGAQHLINAHRPAIAVEVDRHNYDDFWGWLERNRYQVIRLIRPNRANENFICIPAGPRERT
jgi:FkbM family methyltransferase